MHELLKPVPLDTEGQLVQPTPTAEWQDVGTGPGTLILSFLLFSFYFTPYTILCTIGNPTPSLPS